MREVRRSGFKIMTQLIKLLKPLSVHMAAAIFFGVIGHLCAIAVTVLGAAGLYMSVTGGVKMVRSLFYVIGTCAVLRGVFHYLEQNRNHYIAFTLLAVIRDHIFTALRRLAPAKLDTKNKGDLISTITSDIELLEVFYAHTISPIAIAIITGVVMCVFFATLHPLLALVALCAYLFVGAVLPIVSSRYMNADGMSVRTGAGDLSAFVLDSLRGSSVTLLYGDEKRRLKRMDEKSDALNTIQKRLSRAQGHEAALTDVSILAFSALMLFAALALYSLGIVGFYEVLLSVVGMMSSFGPAAALSALAGSLAQTLSSGERVLRLLEEAPEVEEVVSGSDVAFESMCLDHVDFSYDGTHKVLDDFNLAIAKTGITGITGKSGAGKSTALKMLMRFHDVEAGSVTITGRDIRQVNTKSLRHNQALVTQQTQLFHDSIENNIRIGRKDASREEVMDAAKKASIHEFILTLPNGYETNVGELGELLSSGERQRIGLARAFLSDAPLILLDEPTSNLDTLNEGRILKTLHDVKGEKSIVLVSHRPGVKRLSDHNYAVGEG